MDNELVLASAVALATAVPDDPELMTAIITMMFQRSLEEQIVVPNVRFNVDTLTDAEAVFKLRFTRAEVKRLAIGFKLPDVIITPQNVRVRSLEAVCLVLRRLSYPGRLKDLTLEFGRHWTLLSSLFNQTIKHIFDRFKERLAFDVPMLQRYARESADAIQTTSGCLRDCIGFVDGTVRPMCRPTCFQRQCYNGHKRVHLLKFQGVTIANGLNVSMFGPIEGRRHDVALLRESMLGQKMSEYCPGFYLYGDPAYPLCAWLISPFKTHALRDVEARFNMRMSSSRVTVEWSVGSILRYWAFLDFKKLLKVFLSPVAKYYMIGTLLTNCITCLHGCQTATFFGCSPPTLEEYLEL